MITNSLFIISKSLFPDVVDHCYFKQWIMFDQTVKVWNIKNITHLLYICLILTPLSKLVNTSFSSKYPVSKIENICCFAPGLNPDTFYSFRVEAENSLGSGYPSPVQSIRTSQDNPGGAPDQVSVKPTSSQSLLVTWKVSNI